MLNKIKNYGSDLEGSIKFVKGGYPGGNEGGVRGATGEGNDEPEEGGKK